jgi:hypothetical protein
MRASFQELPPLVEAGPSQVRGSDWGGMRIQVASVPAGTDFTPLLAGLPNDRCPCDHWGYVVRGRLRVYHADGTEEIVQAGDYYHMPKGHTAIALEDTEFLEVGDPAPHQQFVENARKIVGAAVRPG